MRTWPLLVVAVSLLACGDSTSDCVTPDLTGGWTETERSSMTLTQTCAGAVVGLWTTQTAAGVESGAWNVSGTSDGSRFSWTGQCANQKCTYDVVMADGTDGTGMDILDGGDRLEGSFSVPGRAAGMMTMRRDN